MKRFYFSFVLMIMGLSLAAQDHVSVYSGCNFEGDSQRLYEGSYLDRDLKVGNDRISSIRVPRGWMVTVYKSNNYGGPSETYYEDVRCLPEQFNDAISSIKVSRSNHGGNAVSIYSGCNFEGDSQTLQEGQYRDRDIKIGNDRISSIRVPNGWSVTVYKSNDFEGSSETYHGDVRCLSEKFNDAISSLRVHRSGSSHRNDNYNANRNQNANRVSQSNRVNFNATGMVPCRIGRGATTHNCDFGVVRRGNGDADVHITKSDGSARVIYFQNGRAVGYDKGYGSGPDLRATKESDLYMITIGDEHYEIPEAVIYGG